jgi:mono/diheme cytochrome c family protein
MSPRVQKTGIVCVAMCLPVLVAAGTSARQGGNAAAKKLTNPIKATPESVAAGQQIYQKYCSFCHNSDGKGRRAPSPKVANPSNLTDAKWDHGSSDGEIFASIRDGVGPKFDMKPYKESIPERDTWHVVNYLRSLGSKK